MRERFLNKFEVVAIGRPNRNADHAQTRPVIERFVVLRPIHRRRPGPRRAAARCRLRHRKPAPVEPRLNRSAPQAALQGTQKTPSPPGRGDRSRRPWSRGTNRRVASSTFHWQPVRNTKAGVETNGVQRAARDERIGTDDLPGMSGASAMSASRSPPSSRRNTPKSLVPHRGGGGQTAVTAACFDHHEIGLGFRDRKETSVRRPAP